MLQATPRMHCNCGNAGPVMGSEPLILRLAIATQQHVRYAQRHSCGSARSASGGFHRQPCEYRCGQLLNLGFQEMAIRCTAATMQGEAGRIPPDPPRRTWGTHRCAQHAAVPRGRPASTQAWAHVLIAFNTPQARADSAAATAMALADAMHLAPDSTPKRRPVSYCSEAAINYAPCRRYTVCPH